MAALGLTAIALSCQNGPKLTDNERRGKQIYEGLCNKCHQLIDPTRYSDDQWDASVVKYGVQLKLTSDEQNLLKAYLHKANDVAK